jgi:hypothetical protein
VALRPELAARRAGSGTLPTLLTELAAERDPGTVAIDAQVLAAAREHRMTGLLWTWLRERDAEPELKTQVAMTDLHTQAHLARVWSVLETSVSRLDAIGIEVATIKGVTAEARWYARPGERPCSDVDLLLGPHQLDRTGDAVGALDPHHPWLPHVNTMANSARVQSVTLNLEGLEVDLHLDLLKLGIPTRQTYEFWERTTVHALPSGGSVRVLDDTVALMHLLVHLNKDRFQRLLGYADIPRVLGNGQVDLQAMVRLAGREGIEVPVLRSLETVLDHLGLAWPEELERARGPRSAAWSLLWRPGIRLRGREGRLRFRRRQDWISFLARGRLLDSSRWWVRELLPPGPTVNHHYGYIRGPYLWKLVRGRLEAAVAHGRKVAGVRTGSWLPRIRRG